MVLLLLLCKAGSATAEVTVIEMNVGRYQVVVDCDKLGSESMYFDAKFGKLIQTSCLLSH